jgi:hypothetical protein
MVYVGMESGSVQLWEAWWAAVITAKDTPSCFCGWLCTILLPYAHGSMTSLSLSFLICKMELMIIVFNDSHQS